MAAPPPPGMALDLGCALGDDAIWLATRGWPVAAVDVSATALRRGSTRAAELGISDRVDFQRHDLAFTFPEGTCRDDPLDSKGGHPDMSHTADIPPASLLTASRSRRPNHAGAPFARVVAAGVEVVIAAARSSV